MKKGKVVPVAIFLLLGSFLLAEVQWLQYRTSERAREIVGGSSQYMRPHSEKLGSEKIPETKQDDPVFFQWRTPMDSAGFRWIMLDKQHKYGLCDTLYLDSDGDGRLDDETKIKGRQSSQYEVEFNQVPMTFDSEDGPITYHLNISFRSYDERSTYMYAYTGCWYEGKVTLAGKETRCVLVDYNCNGAFDDKSADFNSDRILTGPEERSHQGYVGNYLELNDKLYRLNIARDGAFVELTDASDVAYGTLTMPKSITTLTAGGLNGMFERTVKDGKVSLPEGRYRVMSWNIERADDKGAKWQLSGTGFRKEKDFDVQKETPFDLDVGEPVFSKLEARVRNGVYSFNQSLVGKSGERISLTKAGRRIPAPKVHVKNKNGTYDRTFTLEYG